MIAIRKGNDIPVYFTVYRMGEPMNLDQAQNIQIKVHHELLCNSDLPIAKIDVDSNPLYFEVLGDSTSNAPEGNYYALVTFEMPNPYTGQMSYFSVDSKAFRLIDHSRNQGAIPTCEVCEEVTMPLLLGGTVIIAKGDPGDSAYEIAVEHGYVGTEEEWLASLHGKDGKSAYQIAVEGGYTGTEEEYNALLTAVPTFGNRIGALENEINSIKTEQVSQNEAIEANRTSIDGINTSITSINGEIDTIKAEQITQNSAIEANKTAIDALQGAIIYIGDIALATPNVTQAALNARAKELGYDPLKRGYCLIDLGRDGTGVNANDWVYNGTEWVNIGYYVINIATTTDAGIVKSSNEDYKVSVNTDGIMTVNNFIDLVWRTIFTSYQGVEYNSSNNTYTVNDIPDINSTVMMQIYLLTATQIYSNNLRDRFNFTSLPTNIRPQRIQNIEGNDQLRAFRGAQFKKVYIANSYNWYRSGTVWQLSFSRMDFIDEIVGQIRINITAVDRDITGIFTQSSIRSFRMTALNVSLMMESAPNIDRDSILWIVNNSSNGDTNITLTILPSVMARLTTEDIALASSRNITIAEYAQ